MPFSFEQGKQYTRNIVGRIKHDRMLDIGPGSGTYAKMFPEAEWTGIEIWEPYVEQYGLKDLYKEIIVADSRKYDFSSLGRFDVAIAGDVLEHMTADEAKDVLERLKSVADTVIVSIPIGHHPQGEWEGNPYEEHVVDDWTDDRVKEALGNPTWSAVDGAIGVYCWSNQKIMPKICVYTISKNEEQFVKRWADSARDADLLLIADTGSTDRTVEIAKECGIQTHEICITPWRFDHARNASIALIPKDIDICICMDVDEVLEPGWRKEIERVWTPETTRLSYMFDWGCDIRFRYEKIHARHGYFWHHPCHEYPVYDKRIKEVYAYTDMLLVSHHPDPTKSRGQYMDLLQLSVDEDPLCPRNAFYYARELSFHGRYQDAINACKKYLDMPNANWANERCYAMRVMAKCYNELGDLYNAEIWYQRSAMEAPNTREPWCELAMLFYRMGRWPECYAASMRALGIKDRQLVYTCDPAVWGHWAHDLASISAWHMGLKDVALEQAKIAVEHSPGDERLRNNLSFIENAINAQNRIPNVVHFMWFTGPKSRDFSFVNYLAIRSAHEVQKPDKIYLYYNEDLTSNPHWQAVKPFVEMVKTEPPTEYEGKSLNDWPQYQADVLRLRTLYEKGGIYLDTDCIMIRPFGDLLENECVMAGFAGDVDKDPKHKVQSFSAATILSRPKSGFIKLWLDGLKGALEDNVWASHVVNLPVEIYKENKNLLTLMPMEAFLPFDFNDDSILDSSKIKESINNVGDAYLVHMWDSVWQEKLKNISDDYLSSAKNGFTKLFGQYKS